MYVTIRQALDVLVLYVNELYNEQLDGTEFCLTTMSLLTLIYMTCRDSRVFFQALSDETPFALELLMLIRVCEKRRSSELLHVR